MLGMFMFIFKLNHKSIVCCLLFSMSIFYCGLAYSGCVGYQKVDRQLHLDDSSNNVAVFGSFKIRVNRIHEHKTDWQNHGGMQEAIDDDRKNSYISISIKSNNLEETNLVIHGRAFRDDAETTLVTCKDTKLTLSWGFVEHSNTIWISVYELPTF